MRQEDGSVDFGDLVRKLVVFEEVILDSPRLTEIPPLVEKFGYAGMKALLESRRLRIHAEAVTIGEIGRTTVLESVAAKGALPLGSYMFANVRLADRRNDIHNMLQPINAAAGVDGKQSKKLRRLVAETIAVPPDDSGERALELMMADLKANASWIKDAIALVARRDHAKDIDPSQFELRVEQIGDREFRTETNIGQLLGLDDEATHKLVSGGLLGSGGMGHRIEFMERYNAVSGFRTDEGALFDAKLGFLARQLDPEVHLERLERVVELAGLPDASPDPADHDVDMPKLLDILGSDEAREFRCWLRTVDSLDDKQVKDEISKLREIVRHAVNSGIGRAIRFTATAGVGVIAPPVGLALGATDSLLLDKLVREPGPTAFLSRLYPTVFE
jgi:hypothetical protein